MSFRPVTLGRFTVSPSVDGRSLFITCEGKPGEYELQVNPDEQVAHFFAWPDDAASQEIAVPALQAWPFYHGA